MNKHVAVRVRVRVLVRVLVLVLVPVLVLGAGCATASALRAGQRAERLQDYDRAVAEYTRALRTTPADG